MFTLRPNNLPCPSVFGTTNSGATRRCHRYRHAGERGNDDAAHLHRRICMRGHGEPRVCPCRIFDVYPVLDAAVAKFFIPLPCTHLRKIEGGFPKSSFELHNIPAHTRLRSSKWRQV